MRFVVEIPDKGFMSESGTAEHVRNWLRTWYGDEVQVMIDDRPD